MNVVDFILEMYTFRVQGESIQLEETYGIERLLIGIAYQVASRTWYGIGRIGASRWGASSPGYCEYS